MEFWVIQYDGRHIKSVNSILEADKTYKTLFEEKKIENIIFIDIWSILLLITTILYKFREISITSKFDYSEKRPELQKRVKSGDFFTVVIIWGEGGIKMC